MISEKEAKNIAGQILIKKFGQEYIMQNKKRLSTMTERTKEKIRIYFEIHQQNLDEIPSTEKDGEIHVEEKNFPDTILCVEVDLKDGNAKTINNH